MERRNGRYLFNVWTAYLLQSWGKATLFGAFAKPPIAIWKTLLFVWIKELQKLVISHQLEIEASTRSPDLEERVLAYIDEISDDYIRRIALSENVDLTIVWRMLRGQQLYLYRVPSSLWYWLCTHNIFLIYIFLRRLS